MSLSQGSNVMNDFENELNLMLGVHIREFRLRSGFTQIDVVKRVQRMLPNFTQSRLSRIESGLRTATPAELAALESLIGLRSELYVLADKIREKTG
jgi:transcriptional regulator with XRE-family HTH domain